MKMSALTATPAAGAAAAAAPKNAYIPPSRRKDTGEAAKPKTITTDELANQALFPSLGGPSGSLKAAAGGGASWGQIRAKLSTSNTFSALSEETDVSGTSVISTPSLNFKGMLKERIEKDKAEEALLQMEETDDPAEMNDTQLRKNGWAKLTLPPKDTESRKQWCEAFHTRLEQLDGMTGGPLIPLATAASSPTKTKKTGTNTVNTPLPEEEDADSFFSDTESEHSFEGEDED